MSTPNMPLTPPSPPPLSLVIPTRAAGAGPSDTANDLRTVKTQMVFVYSSTGTFLDVWRDAPLLGGFKEAINSAPQPLRVTLPRLFDSFDQAGIAGNIGTIGQGNLVKYYLFGPGLPVGGLLRYQGTIDKFEPAISESGAEQVTVTITPPGAAVGDNGLVGTLQMGSATATSSSTAVAGPGSATIVVASASGLVVGAYIPIDTGANLEYVTITALSGTNLTATFARAHSGTYSVGGPMDPVAMFLYWFSTNDPYTSLPYTQPLTLDSAGSLTSSTTQTWYTWQNQDLASIWNTIILMLRNDSPNWYWRINPAGTVTLNKTPTISPAQNVLYVGKHLAVPQYAQDWMNLRNLVLVVGSSPSVSSVASGSDLLTFGHRGYSVADTRITTQAQASVLANGYLTALDRAIFRGQYRVVDYRGDAQVGIGYDIESMKVGQSVQIVTPRGASGSNTLTWDAGLWDGGAVWGGPVSAAENQVVQVVSISYDFDAITIETGNFGPSQDIALIKLAAYLQDFSVVL